ncbi:Ste50p [Kluyveromyces lactis]|uniref:KLLA0C01386p n=1 Tax=Kluyveromyces lactis (strain ATCC 8585 / CBS 2359 / DSM 70799 / NBRC 1267 / NRRL Y-1140 / WM37) TaxID=284590 RepID=Q6CUY2_KLULA|nr:uncharacterized protein KLLA0_C01386g [Kluyveromyces lactis]CAH01108.1 KLLA0C01386p [Kluyveromyces lactis]|eukprot:XP_452257.1 uncharacterized protein KLLA0_C01386g [Kluyveromyces lactis]
MSGTNEWSTEEVCKKVKAELGLTDGDTFILDRIRENKITGSTLSEITLADCKELCPDSISAVRLKTCINKFVDTEEQAPEQELVLTMKGLHQTLNEKLQEFQSNYAQLRLDLLEIVKRNSGSGSGSSQSSQQLQHQPSSQDYFDRAPHHSSHTPSSPKYRSNSNPGLPPQSSSTRNVSSSHIATTPGSANTPGGAGVSSAPSSEPMKQLRASKEDSCEKVLRNAMKRHNLNETDWRQHVLVICYGDQERVLDLDEKPVQIFKSLKQQGLHPAIMLRQKGDFEEVGEMAATPGGRL